MPVVVKVAPGYSRVPLPGGLYNTGQQITLTDEEYGALPSYILSQLMSPRSVPVGQVAVQAPTPTPTPSESYTSQLIASLLVDMGVGAVLRWDGSDYQPAEFKADTSRNKTFIGPEDPNTISGVVLSTFDQWIKNN